MCIVEKGQGHMRKIIDAGRVVSTCYRREQEADLRAIAKWWISIDPSRNFVTLKQGTLMQAVMRGGELGNPRKTIGICRQKKMFAQVCYEAVVSRAEGMMPWDRDLEFVLMTSGPMAHMFGGPCTCNTCTKHEQRPVHTSSQ